MIIGGRLDRLTELLKEAEDELSAHGYVVPAEIPLGEEILSWTKEGANWALFIQLNPENRVPLLRAASSRRIMAACVLPVLKEKLDIAMSDHRLVDRRGDRGSGKVRQRDARHAAIIHGELHNRFERF